VLPDLGAPKTNIIGNLFAALTLALRSNCWFTGSRSLFNSRNKLSRPSFLWNEIVL